MKFLPDNPKKRQMILIVGGVVVALFAFGFFYNAYFSPSKTPDDGLVSIQTNSKIKLVSEDAIKKLENNVADIRGELDQKFYKNLKRYSWPKDNASPGNSNLFFLTK